MLVRRWGVALALGAIACGKSTSDGPTNLAGSGGTTMSVLAGSGGRASGGGDANAAGGTMAMPVAAGGVTALAGAPGLAAGAGGLSQASAGASSGGVVGLASDPQPAADPVAVVGTSNSYLVFRQGSRDPDIKLMFLDLKGSGQPVQVNAANSKVITPKASDNGRFLIHEQVDALQSPSHGSLPTPTAEDLQLVTFTDSGYIPGAAVAGFSGLTAMRLPGAFDASSRFVAFSRLDSRQPAGLDIVDAAKQRRHASLSGPRVLGGVNWAPKGYFFTYRAKTNLSDNPNNDILLAKLTSDGISEPQALPAYANQATFTADGQRLFYSIDNGTIPFALGYIDPPAAPRQIYSGTGPNGFIGFWIEAGGQSLLTTLPDPNGGGLWVVARIFVDPARPPQFLTEPSYSSSITMSESGSLAVLSILGDTTTRLEFLRGTERIKIAEGASISGTFTGEHLVYYPDTSESKIFWEVRSATLVGSTVVDRRLAPADRNISSFCQRVVPNPGTKFNYVYDQPVPGIRFSDLEVDGPGATRTIDATNPAATVDCPVCNTTGDACAYVERTDTSSKIFVVRFGPTGPSEPTLAFQSDQSLALYLAHLQ